MRVDEVDFTPDRSLRSRIRLVGLLPVAAGARQAAALVAATFAQAVLPTVIGLVSGLLVSRLASPAPDHRGTLIVLTLSIGLLMWAGELIEVAVSVRRFAVTRRVDAWHRDHLAELVLRPAGIEKLERQSFQDELAVGVMKGMPGWIGYTLGSGAVGQLVMATRSASTVLSAAVLAWFSWPLALGVLVSALLLRVITQRVWLVQHAVVRQLAPVGRFSEYWAEVATAQWSAKELRVFALTDWVVDRYRTVVLSRTDRLARVRVAVLRRMVAVSAALVVATVAGLALLAHEVLVGRISAGDLAICLGAFWGVLAGSRWDAESFDVEFAGLPALASADRLAEQVGPAPDPVPAPAPRDAPLVRFESVGFRYPGSPRPTLDGVDLEIGPGELVALVGVNGAGKTTLTKLLGGLYQPTTGRITVDGTDIRDLEPARWRQRISVVFQEFNKYELSLRDNIVLGAGDTEPDQAALDSVVGKAGIADLTARGWDTPLASTYAGGVELSGGQWQRIALARALYAVARGARLLVLDEPTAHLDVAAEQEVFDRLVRESGGAGILLISHRLATVRHADRIVFLDGGRITEVGTHAQLLAADGEYAHMYRLQADRFAEAEVSR